MAVVQTVFTPFIDGARLIDGGPLNEQLAKPHYNASDGLVAHAGGGQTNALLMTARINRYTTVASAGDSAKLPSSAAGKVIYVVNDTSNAMQVYGSGSDTINDVATGTGMSVSANSATVYVGTVPGKWYSVGSLSGNTGTGANVLANGATLTNATISLAAAQTGTFTANGATAVVVSAPTLTANSVISYALKTVGGTPAAKPYESAVTPGTGFSVKVAAGDTSVYNYAIIG